MELGTTGRPPNMAIYRLIANGSFGPDEITAMSEAYEGALIDLGILNRDDPVTELTAKSIVNVTATGERHPTLIKERAINTLGIRRTSVA
jgi:hypothetical protein